MMVNVLPYGYVTKVFLSQEIAENLGKDVSFRMLGAGNLPSFKSVHNIQYTQSLPIGLQSLDLLQAASCQRVKISQFTPSAILRDERYMA